MKVVLINDQLNAGGAEKVLVNIANLLYKNGINVSVVLYLKPAALDHLINKSIPLIYLNRKSRFDFSAMRALKKHVKNADIVHIHSRYNFRYFMLCKYLLYISKIKIAFHEHVPGFQNTNAITRWLLNKTDVYIGVQQAMCNWVTDQKILSGNKVFFLPNIVSKPSSVISGSPGGGKILMVANFRRIKNQLFAIQVLQALGTGYSLHFYGMVDEQDYYEEVLQAVKEKNLEEQVSITKGVTNIYDVLPNYSFAIHTATNETGPLVLLEYMNAGLPFFTYNTGDVAQSIQDKMPEVILSSFEVSEWVDRIKTISSNPEKTSSVKQKAIEIINTNYTEEKYWERLNTIYIKTLEAV